MPIKHGSIHSLRTCVRGAKSKGMDAALIMNECCDLGVKGVAFAQQKHVKACRIDAIMIQIDQESLKPLARKYIWWKTPEEAVAMPERVIAQVMNIGDYADVQSLASQVGDDALRVVLTQAQAGQFNERSWAYWHYRLGLSNVDQVPALPVRKFS